MSSDAYHQGVLKGLKNDENRLVTEIKNLKAALETAKRELGKLRKKKEPTQSDKQAMFGHNQNIKSLPGKVSTKEGNLKSVRAKIKEIEELRKKRPK